MILKSFSKVVMSATLLAAFMVPAQADKLYGTLKKINDSGEIVIGHRESSIPFSYLDDAKKPAGYSIDLCLKVVEAVEKKLNKKITVKYQSVNPKTRIPLVANGTVDIECGSTTNKVSRQEQVAFLYTTFITGTKLLVKKSLGANEIEDLKGKVIAVAQGTTNERIIKTLSKEKGLDIKVVSVKDHAEGFLTVQTDRADAYATDHILLFGLITKAKKPADYDVVGRFLSYDPYGIMVRRDDSAFQTLANSVLTDLFKSGQINDIYNKRFVNDKFNVPVTELLKASFKISAYP